MKKYFLYIGSNNETHELEADRACEIIAQVFEGFSIYEIIGYWKGSKEKTLKVEIVSDETGSDARIIELSKEIAKELKQDAVMVETFNSNIAFIQ